MSFTNEIRIIGYLGNDPELRRLDNGSAVVRCSVATRERWVDKTTGEQKEQTDWHIVKGWGRIAERMFELLRKGTKIVVVGRLKYDEWEKDGVKHTRAYILADGFEVAAQMAMTPEEGKTPPPTQQLPQRPGARPGGEPVKYPTPDDTEALGNTNFDDLPF